MSIPVEQIQTATKIARETRHDMRSLHVSLISNKRKILAIGVNKRRTHSKAPQTEHGRFLHAEVASIINCDRGALKGSHMYVVRIGKRGDLRMSKPCKFCQAAIMKAGIKVVYYSINSENIGFWNIKNNDWKVISV